MQNIIYNHFLKSDYIAGGSRGYAAKGMNIINIHLTTLVLHIGYLKIDNLQAHTTFFRWGSAVIYILM